jgi:hypothetical protein
MLTQKLSPDTYTHPAARMKQFRQAYVDTPTAEEIQDFQKKRLKEMKITRRQLKQIIKEELDRLSYVSKEQGFTYGLDHVSKKDKSADDIIGHT